MRILRTDFNGIEKLFNMKEKDGGRIGKLYSKTNTQNFPSFT